MTFTAEMPDNRSLNQENAIVLKGTIEQLNKMIRNSGYQLVQKSEKHMPLLVPLRDDETSKKF